MEADANAPHGRRVATVFLEVARLRAEVYMQRAKRIVLRSEMIAVEEARDEARAELERLRPVAEARAYRDARYTARAGTAGDALVIAVDQAEILRTLAPGAGVTTWEDLVDQDRDCRVYWGHSGCNLPRGHEGEHVSESGSRPYMGFMYGEDTTEEERVELE